MTYEAVIQARIDAQAKTDTLREAIRLRDQKLADANRSGNEDRKPDIPRSAQGRQG